MSEHQDSSTPTPTSTVDAPSSLLSLLGESPLKGLQNLKLRTLLACRLICRTKVPSRELSLPVELSTRVLQNLDLLTLLACRLTCHPLKNLADSTLSLQYKTALRNAGMGDNPSSTHPTHVRLQKLAKYTDAWKELRWTEHTVLTSKSGAKPLRLWEIHDCIVAYVIDCSLVFHQLPSRLRGVAARDWEIFLPFRVEDFKFDVLHDVLMVLQRDLSNYSLHVMSLSTGGVHPLSKEPRISFDGLPAPSGNNAQLDYSLKIGGDYCGILFRTRGEGPYTAKLLVLDWKTGDTIWAESSESARAFVFLSGERCLLLVLSGAGGKLPTQPHLDVWFLRKNEQAYMCSSFLFPPLAEDLVVDFLIHENKPCGPSSPLNRNAPFAVNDADQLRLLGVTYSVGNVDINLFIRLSALIQLVERNVQSIPPHKPYDWATWVTDVVRIAHFEQLCGTRSAVQQTTVTVLRGSIVKSVNVHVFHPYPDQNPFSIKTSEYIEHLIQSAGGELSVDTLSAELPLELQNSRLTLECFLSEDNIVLLEFDEHEQDEGDTALSQAQATTVQIHLLTF
ncbi:hypothetical protein FA95DRAFT_1289354 [Auriscalpium vulgare]|uniref:Uncharacterized protein n=1 Tax=Auriscalpium vulgare TaxID=40419 RepID=A0ACB8RS03_9AGAM|nr:hypothetical protein FA95DRAFT_1289354 [Auriscalpium vulgare]